MRFSEAVTKAFRQRSANFLKHMASGFKSTGVAIVELCSHSGAEDGFVLQGQELIESTLSISDKDAERLAKSIGNLAGQYRDSGRLGSEICLSFEKGSLLIVWGGAYGVALRFRDEIDRIEAVVAECRTFLKQVLSDAVPEQAIPVAVVTPEPPPPDENLWKRYEPRLVNLLTGVVPRPQASRMIQRILESMELSGAVPDDMLKEITGKVIQKIPDRRKRESLTAEANEELEHILNS